MRRGLLLLGALIALSTRINAQDCYESSILSPAPFLGINEEIFKLADGSLWEVKYEYEYLYEYYPSVVICPGRGRLVVGKKSLNVEAVAAAPGKVGSGEWEIYEETNLKGSISGTIQQGHVFRTTSGTIYEVTGLTLQLVLELQPDVMVLRNGDVYKLIVEEFEEPLICSCINCASEPRIPELSERYFTVGSTSDEVQAIQGRPTRELSSGMNTTWWYGPAWVKFKAGKVIAVSGEPMVPTS